MRRRLILAAVVCVMAAGTECAYSQELLTNGSLEFPSAAGAGRNAVPEGWQMSEGPLVAELPPGPALPGTGPGTLGPYDGDYNNSGLTDACQGLLCGFVDAADYTVWRDHLGQNFALPNRYRALTGNVSNSDYTTWKMNFGKPNALSMAEPGNFSHLQFDGDWHMWFQPYNSNRTEPDVDDGVFEAEENFAHLTQKVAGTPGLEYTMEGWALFEDYFPGGATNLNLANPDGTGTGAPFDDGPLSPTDTFFALEFLDNNGTVLDESVAIELKAAGQLSNTFWQKHTLSAIAPAGTVNVRVRASMIDGVENPLPCPQCFQMSFFVDAFSLTAQSAGSGAGAVPEPASWLLGATAIGAMSVFRRRNRTSRA